MYSIVQFIEQMQNCLRDDAFFDIKIVRAIKKETGENSLEDVTPNQSSACGSTEVCVCFWKLGGFYCEILSKVQNHEAKSILKRADMMR